MKIIWNVKWSLVFYWMSWGAEEHHCGIYSLNNKLKGVSLRGNWLLPSLPHALNAAWATAGWGARGAWWEMEAFLPAAVSEHRSVVRFPRALIRQPPLRKHTCRQPMRRCPAAHTGPAYTRTDANTLASKTHTPSELCSEFLLVLIWFVSEIKK